MPLVRIDICKGKDATYRQEIGRIVYNALVDVGVPQDDRFQVIGEHSAEDFLFDSDYLGIHRTEELVVIQITWNEGRSITKKGALQGHCRRPSFGNRAAARGRFHQSY
jgi:4-oxalocrotonate tautomerase